MKHVTKISPLIDVLKNLEKQELIEVLREKAEVEDVNVGGTKTVKYVYKFPEPTLFPCIEFYGGNGPASAEVTKVEITIRPGDGSASIDIHVWDIVNGPIYKVSPEDVYVGFLSVLTDAINNAF